jgi:ATP-dependent protease ClpP protease subunit
MNYDYDYDDIYNEWVNSSVKLFSKWSDADFYSNKAEHIYFYDMINQGSLNAFESILKNVSKTSSNSTNTVVSPKPIVVHLCSPGGHLTSMNLFNTLITTIRVPLCVIIEQFCASAATTLALLAPYRLMIDYSTYLIHDSSSVSYGKTSEKIVSGFKYDYQMQNNYLQLLQKRTKLSPEQIKMFISRDMCLDSNYCKNNGIVDRVLRFPSIKKDSDYDKSVYTDLQLSLPTLLKKTNMNHLYINNMALIEGEGQVSSHQPTQLSSATTMTDVVIALDHILMNDMLNIKPIMVHFRAHHYETSNPLEFLQIQYRLAMIQKKIPVIALIEGPISLDSIGTALMCPIRLMLTPSILSSDFTYRYRGSMGYGMKTIDVIFNTNYVYNEVVRFLRQFSKLPPKFYKEFKEKLIRLKPNDALKYNIINQVVHFTKVKPLTLKNMEDYYQLNSLVEDYNSNKPVAPRKSTTHKTTKKKSTKSAKSAKSTKSTKSAKSAKSTKSTKSTKPTKSTKSKSSMKI